MDNATRAVEDQPGERWAPIPRYGDDYLCSNMGRVYSVKSGRLLKAYRDRHDYLRLRLSRFGKTRLESVAELVLESFVGPRPDGKVIRHLNDVSSDARLDNLRWGTMSENRYDSVRNGRHFQANLTHCKRGHELVAPNLRATALRQGRRGCLVCSAEQDRARHIGSEPDYRRADQRYRELTGKESQQVERVRLTNDDCELVERAKVRTAWLSSR